MTRYPNLLAEYEAENFGHISTLADRANVTKELMQAVLYEGAELTDEEIKNIGHSSDYIKSETLTYMDESDDIRTKALIERAEKITAVPEDFKEYTFERGQCKTVIKLREKMRRGERLTVAEYRAAKSAVESVEYYTAPKKEPRGLCKTKELAPTAPPKIERRKRLPKKAPDVIGIDSREVAEMVGKPHNDLMKTIRQFCKYLIAGNLSLNDFFLESTYKDSIGRTLPCYVVTRKGCEMVANKMTGEKGVLFTATYINRFHEMEAELSGGAQTAPAAPDAQTANLMQVLVEAVSRIQVLESKLSVIVNANEAIAELPETTVALDPLFKTPSMLYTTTAIGKAFGISARAVNRLLHSQGIHHPEGRGWELDKRYTHCKYVYQKVGRFTNEDGETVENLMTWWTAEGAEFVRLLLLKAGLKQKSQITPYNRHGNRGKRKAMAMAIA